MTEQIIAFDAALDDPVGESLRGHHAHLARRVGGSLAYLDDVATFVAVPVDPRPSDWHDMAALLGPDGFVDLFSAPARPPEGWPPVFSMEGWQLVGPPDAFARQGVDTDLVELGAADVPEMMDLVRRTEPGPFLPRTHLLGSYLGIRLEGRLVAMAGERLHPPGWTEISAVCTEPSARGRGLAGRLVRELATRIVERGERPFLHVATHNQVAAGLYRRLGFRDRRVVTFHGYRVPA